MTPRSSRIAGMREGLLQAPVGTSSSEAAREMLESRLAWRGLRRVHSDSQVRDCVKAVLQRKPLRRFVCLHAFI
jgi:hypothetical protein